VHRGLRPTDLRVSADCSLRIDNFTNAAAAGDDKPPPLGEQGRWVVVVVVVVMMMMMMMMTMTMMMMMQVVQSPGVSPARSLDSSVGYMGRRVHPRRNVIADEAPTLPGGGPHAHAHLPRPINRLAQPGRRRLLQGRGPEEIRRDQTGGVAQAGAQVMAGVMMMMMMMMMMVMMMMMMTMMMMMVVVIAVGFDPQGQVSGGPGAGAGPAGQAAAVGPRQAHDR
jgi:hypothetical protein